MSAPSLAISGLSKRFGGVVAVDAVELQLESGELHALIGPNGAGKTTLVQLLSGAERVDAGSIHLDGRDITHVAMHQRAGLGLGRSYQISSVFAAFSVLDNLALAAQARARRRWGCWAPVAADAVLFAAARGTLDAIGLSARAETPAGALAHGERRQLELGLALASGASMLLLDEPMAGMAAAEAERMLALIASLRGKFTILLVEHDMDAVFRLADRITVLVYGRVIATGGAEDIRRHPDVRRAYLGEDQP